MPIPAWDENNRTHQRLSTMCEIAEKTIKGMDIPPGQIAASKRIREQLSEDGTFEKIDKLVQKILPDHVLSH